MGEISGKQSKPNPLECMLKYFLKGYFGDSGVKLTPESSELSVKLVGCCLGWDGLLRTHLIRR